MVGWQDEDDNRKNLLHWLVDERLESKCVCRPWVWQEDDIYRMSDVGSGVCPRERSF